MIFYIIILFIVLFITLCFIMINYNIGTKEDKEFAEYFYKSVSLFINKICYKPKMIDMATQT
jgi:hypothetical protein